MFGAAKFGIIVKSGAQWRFFPLLFSFLPVLLGAQKLAGKSWLTKREQNGGRKAETSENGDLRDNVESNERKREKNGG